MRWLLLKDLQILRRSPLLVGLLIIYPIAISLLIGFALSRGPERPTVAFVNEVPPSETMISLGGEDVDLAQYTRELVKDVDLIDADSREDALQKVRDGEAVGALIIPPDAAEKLRSVVGLSGSPQRPTIEFAYSEENPLKGEYVRSLIDSTLSQANRALSDEITKEAARYLGYLLNGGNFRLLGQDFEILGLRKTDEILRDSLQTLPADAPQRDELERVQRFSKLAIDNLDLSDDVLGAVSTPLDVKQRVVGGAKTPLDAFAVAVSITVSLMFVCVLLAAGMLALEREEHAFGRLVRGLVSRGGLVAEKIGLAAVCAFVVGVLMVGVVAAFVDLDASNVPQWVAALALGALAFGALGVAVGALAREVRAASLLAFLLTLPITFLALVPSGAVADGLYDVIRVISALFPFKPTLDALDAALNDTGSIGGPLLHLAALTVGFGVIARIGLRRFA